MRFWSVFECCIRLFVSSLICLAALLNKMHVFIFLFLFFYSLKHSCTKTLARLITNNSLLDLLYIYSLVLIIKSTCISLVSRSLDNLLRLLLNVNFSCFLIKLNQIIFICFFNLFFCFFILLSLVVLIALLFLSWFE